MPQILMPYTVHLDHTLRVTPLNTLFAKGDSAAHRFELTILRAGVQDDLTGCTVFCKFYRMADSTVVSVPGNVEGGKAVVALPSACYDYIGRFALTISIKNGDEETTVFYGDGYMHGQRADTAISGEYIIYDIDTLIEKIAEIDAATQAANTATENANTAASNANTARDAANTAASTANTAANNANTAKDAANAAAGKINNMTVSATPIETGTATAALSTVDGHYHLALGLPNGDTGATPQISVQVQTGAAGSEASVSVSGTAENPVIHLTIPRGDTGDIGALTINGKSPDGSGAVTLEMGDIDGLSDAIANAGGVKTVAGVGPDSAGNVPLTAAEVGARPSSWTPTAEEVGARPSSWTPTAAEVGALAVGGTAADSSKLGGKTLAEIMLALYPVGAIYISAVSTSPASLFGGTWTQLTDRFLLGAGGSYSAGGTGGAASHTHTTGSHTLTINEIPSHNHGQRYGDVPWVDGRGVGSSIGGNTTQYGTLTTLKQNMTQDTGGGGAHNHGNTGSASNMPPYLAVYMWKRVS